MPEKVEGGGKPKIAVTKPENTEKPIKNEGEKKKDKAKGISGVRGDMLNYSAVKDVNEKFQKLIGKAGKAVGQFGKDMVDTAMANRRAKLSEQAREIKEQRQANKEEILSEVMRKKTESFTAKMASRAVKEPIYTKTQGPKEADHVNVRDSKGDWEGEKILERMTQYDYKSETIDDDVRCGAAAKVASSVMSGPEAVKNLATEVETRSGGPNALLDHENEALTRLKKGNPTFGDLGVLQECVYQLGVTDTELFSDTGVADASLSSLTGLGGSNVHKAVSDAPRDVANALQNGERAVIYVDTAGTGKGDHYVLLGKTDEGKRFVYDSMTKAGNQIVFEDQNKNTFDHYVDTMAKPLKGTDIWRD